MDSIFRFFEKYFGVIMGFGVVLGVTGAILGLALFGVVLYIAVNFAMSL